MIPVMYRDTIMTFTDIHHNDLRLMIVVKCKLTACAVPATAAVSESKLKL